MKMIKTGISSLDWFLGGGLPSRVILLSGIPGSGNEVFARQIAYYRTKNNDVTYFTVNSTSDYVKEDMAANDLDISELEKRGTWKFYDIKKNQSLIDAVIGEMKKNRTVIVDSLSELLLTHKVEDVISLITAMSVQNKDCEEYHLLLLTEGMQNQQTEIMMQHFAEGVIAFNTSWTANSTIRQIIIKKMRGTTVPVRRIQYNIEKKGFVIETTTRIN